MYDPFVAYRLFYSDFIQAKNSLNIVHKQCGKEDEKANTVLMWIA